MMSINRKTMLILSFVFAVMTFDINVIHCCSKSEPIITTKPPDTTTSKASKTNTMDQDPTSKLPRSERTTPKAGTITERNSTRNRPKTTTSTKTTATSITTMNELICGVATCTLASTKTDCGTFSASCASSFYTGTYTGFFTDADGHRMYAKAAVINSTPWIINGTQIYLYILFVPEFNMWTINTNYALSTNPNATTTPFAYYNSNTFCLDDISGSSWSLANLMSSTYENDSTMTVTCT